MTHPSGFLLIDKPVGPTSHDIVDRVRRITSEHTVGHAGTLDPFATGLLIVGVGREATKHLSLFLGLDKTYEATFVFGASSDTDDCTGVITTTASQPHLASPWKGEETRFSPLLRGSERGLPTVEQINMALPQFLGPIRQIPPAFAAIKIKGEKMYEAARAGKPLTAPPRSVTIYEFALLDPSPSVQDDTSVSLRTSSSERMGQFYSKIASRQRRARVAPFGTPRNDEVYFRIRCSSGTYIRALARDLGKALGTAAYVSELRRTVIGPIHVSESVSLNDLNQKTVEQFLISTESLLSRIQ